MCFLLPDEVISLDWHPVVNDAHNPQRTQRTTLHDLIAQAQAIQKKEEEKRIAEEQAAKERYWKIPICDDDD
ncbi:hypothetical protein Tco_0011838 [Tanacetum coccineum]